MLASLHIPLAWVSEHDLEASPGHALKCPAAAGILEAGCQQPPGLIVPPIDPLIQCPLSFARNRGVREAMTFGTPRGARRCGSRMSRRGSGRCFGQVSD